MKEKYGDKKTEIRSRKSKGKIWYHGYHAKNHVRDICFSLLHMSEKLKIKLKERFLLMQLVKILPWDQSWNRFEANSGLRLTFSGLPFGSYSRKNPVIYVSLLSLNTVNLTSGNHPYCSRHKFKHIIRFNVLIITLKYIH